jgi:hypothetical protein
MVRRANQKLGIGDEVDLVLNAMIKYVRNFTVQTTTKSVQLQHRCPPKYHNESYLCVTPSNSPQQTKNLAENTTFC